MIHFFFFLGTGIDAGNADWKRIWSLPLRDPWPTEKGDIPESK